VARRLIQRRRPVYTCHVVARAWRTSCPGSWPRPARTTYLPTASSARASCAAVGRGQCPSDLPHRALILDIFAQHAKSREQAQFYSRPAAVNLPERLRGWVIRLFQQSGGRGPARRIGRAVLGETKIETYAARIRTLDLHLRAISAPSKVGLKCSAASAAQRRAVVGHRPVHQRGKSACSTCRRRGVLVEDALFSPPPGPDRLRKGRDTGGRPFTRTDHRRVRPCTCRTSSDAFRFPPEEANDADLILHWSTLGRPTRRSQARRRPLCAKRSAPRTGRSSS